MLIAPIVCLWELMPQHLVGPVGVYTCDHWYLVNVRRHSKTIKAYIYTPSFAIKIMHAPYGITEMF